MKIIDNKYLYFILTIICIMIFLEIIGSVYYYIFIKQEDRDLLEAYIGQKYSENFHMTRYKHHPDYNYALNPNFTYPDGYKPYNSEGFRKPEWTDIDNKNIIKIAALGASTTFGIFSRDGKDVWPALVEKKFNSNVRIYNLGVPAYTTTEIIGIVDLILPKIKPDYVILHVGANEAFTAVYPDEGGSDNSKFRHDWNYKPIPYLYKYLMRISRFLRSVGYHIILLKNGFLPGDMVAAIQYPFPENYNQIKENFSNYSGKYFKRNLEKIIKSIKELSAIPLLITHPINPEWEKTEHKIYKYIVKAHLLNNRILKETAIQNNIKCLDLYKLYHNKKDFADALHCNYYGMQKKADIIYNWLKKIIFP